MGIPHSFQFRNKPWLVSSDFNVVKVSDEASNGDVSLLPGMSKFQSMLVSTFLLDHPWIGHFFTWSNKRNDDHILRKLDRVLVNSS